LVNEKDKWHEIHIPLKDVKATSFGREVSDAAPLDRKNVESIGLLLSDKKAAPFSPRASMPKHLGVDARATHGL